jgi:F-type H+-transporting ATPase subunit epsilon
VTAERCTVLAEQAMPVGAIDRLAVDSELKDARGDLGEAKNDVERAIAEREIVVAEAKLAALDSPVY